VVFRWANWPQGMKI